MINNILDFKSSILQKRISFFIILIIAILPYAATAQKFDPQNQIVVKFKQDQKVQKAFCTNEKTLCIDPLDNLDQQFNIIRTQALKVRTQNSIFIINLDEIDIDAAIKAYEATGLFEYVERDFEAEPLATMTGAETIPSETNYDKQWGLHNEGNLSFASSVKGADIDMNQAWSVEQGSAAVIVAVLDTGVDYNHPDLKNRIWKNTKEQLNGLDDDQNGLIDDINGWDFAEEDEDPMDIHGHGTHVAGVVGADANNSIGFAGVDWNCQIMPLKVVRDNNTSSYSDYARAVYYATDQGAKVINLSLTSYSYSQTLEDAFQYAYNRGVTIVAAMGNNSDNTVHHMAKSQYSIAVGASTPQDKRASYSNHTDYIDVIAPGAYIYSLNAKNHSDNNKMLNGTSQAAPIVSGIASLLIAQNPNRTPAMIRDIIRSSAEDRVGPSDQDKPGYDHYYGYGRVNAYHALTNSSGGSPSTVEENADQCASLAGSSCDDSDPCTINDVYDDQCRCAGSYSQIACTPVAPCVISADDRFHTGMGAWSLGGQDAELSYRNGVNESMSVRLRDNSDEASSIYTGSINLQGHKSIRLQFSLYPISMERGEDFFFEVSTDGGANFQILNQWVSESDFMNGVRQSESMFFNDKALSSQTVFRFRCDASSNMDMIYLDDIRIESCNQNVIDCEVGQPCDDGDACTSNDVIKANCNCEGEYIDKDNDGYCLSEDEDDDNACIPDGAACEPSQGNSQCSSLLFSDFESGTDVWNLGGSDTRLYSGYASSGSKSLRIRDNSGVLSSAYTDDLALSSYESVEFSFSFYPLSMEKGEDFLLEISTDGGRTYSVAESWISGTHFSNAQRQSATVIIDNHKLTDQTVLRIRCDASTNSDLVYIDDINISACGGTSLIYDSTASMSQSQTLDDIDHDADILTMEATIYPNPASDFIKVDIKENTFDYTVMRADIYDVAGRLILQSQFSVDQEVMIDITTLDSGSQYVLSVVPADGGQSITSTFFKF